MSDPKGVFEKARFYDCHDSEVLTCRTPEDALAKYLEAQADPGNDIVALITKFSPITVSAFAPRSLDGFWISALARRLLEDAADSFSEEFGNPDSDDDGLDEKAYAAAIPAVVAALGAFYARGYVWSCEKVAERAYDAAAVERILREYYPEWFAGDGVAHGRHHE